MVEVPQECLMRWTAADVRRMIDSGAFEHPERFELVDGLILRKMGQNAPHAIALSLMVEALREVFADAAEVKSGVPLYLTEVSEPEPDAMVTEPHMRRVVRAGDVRLIVEVADTSLRKDQTTKAALYARHGIPEYVIVDVTNRRVEIRRKPNGETWGETLILDEGGEFTPRGAKGAVRVVDLLPDSEEAP